MTLTGCGPVHTEYVRPPLDLPTTPVVLTIDRQWWASFGDPVLDQLVAEALANNLDLAKAAANVQEARANVDGARALFSPRLDGNASAGASQRALTIAVRDTDINKTTATGKAGLGLSWEADLWGRIQDINNAALARLSATEHTQNAVQLSVSTTVADAYFQLRGFDAKLSITRSAVKSQEASTRLEFRRWKAGVGTELAYQQSLAALTSFQTNVPVIESGLRQTELALQMLVGRSPRTMIDGIARSSDPRVPEPLREVDSELLLRRPDVASAEQYLVAANADVNRARTELYPRLGISLIGGLIATSAAWISGVPMFWDASLGMTGNIFDGGLLQSNVDAAEARRQRALAHYTYTVSLAFRETYDALVLIDTSDRQVKYADDEVRTRLRSLELNQKSYDAGRTAQFEVLAETSRVLNAQLSLANARYKQLVARSQYFKALGGGY